MTDANGPKRQIIAIIAIVAVAIAIMGGTIAFALGGSGAPPDSNKPQAAPVEKEEQTAPVEEEKEQPKKQATYRTQLYKQLGLPGPTLVFDYPEDWTIDASCNPDRFSEVVNLKTPTGKLIHFAYGEGVATTGGGATGEQFAEAHFDAKAYPDLRKPNACEGYWWKGGLDLSSDSDAANLSLSVNRWERAAPQLGVRSGFALVDTRRSGGDVFWYYGPVQFFCMDAPDPDEDAESSEIIQVLASLRQEPTEL